MVLVYVCAIIAMLTVGPDKLIRLIGVGLKDMSLSLAESQLG